MNSFPPVDARNRLRAFVTTPVRRQTYRNLLYLGLAFPLGIAYLVVVTVWVVLGIGLSIILVGIPILVALLVVGSLLADVERWLAVHLLGRDFDTRTRLDGESARARLVSALRDRRTWLALLYLPAKFVFGVLAFVVVFTTLTTGITLLFVPLYFNEPGVSVGVLTSQQSGLSVGIVTEQPIELHPALQVGWNKLLVGLETVLTITTWRVQTMPDALAVSLFGGCIALVGLNVVNWLARLAGWFTQLLLDDGYSVVGMLRADWE